MPDLLTESRERVARVLSINKTSNFTKHARIYLALLSSEIFPKYGNVLERKMWEIVTQWTFLVCGLTVRGVLTS